MESNLFTREGLESKKMEKNSYFPEKKDLPGNYKTRLEEMRSIDTFSAMRNKAETSDFLGHSKYFETRLGHCKYSLSNPMNYAFSEQYMRDEKYGYVLSYEKQS